MSIGANTGGNLNIFMFEVGILLRDPVTGSQIPKTMGIHPLVKGPSSIDYATGSMSTVTRTAGGWSGTRGGRAPWRVSLAGTFGVEPRGLGPYIGNGDILHQRFVNEVVKMGEALTQAEFDDCINILTGTPFVSLLARQYVAELSPTPYINFWDFWNQRRFQVVVRSWGDGRQAARGGASGAVFYRMQLDEAGPIVEGSLGTKILDVLFTALTLWKNVNNVLESYTLETILDSFKALAGPVKTLVGETLDALEGQLEAARRVMAGPPTYGTAARPGTAAGSGAQATTAASRPTQDFPDLAGEAAAAADAAADDLGRGGRSPSDDGGYPDYAGAPGEGTNLELDRVEQVYQLREVASACRWQLAAGALFGMSRDEYLLYLTGGARAGILGPAVSGTTVHVVIATDTLASIAEAYGAAEGDILALNRLTPVEALQRDRQLLIPVTRPLGPQPIDGLPTFGSHRGQAAWGADLSAALRVTGAGDLEVLSGPAVLEQGMAMLLADNADALLTASQAVPDVVRLVYLSRRIEALVRSDRRIESAVATVTDNDGDLVVSIEARAINSTGPLTFGV